MSERFLVAGAHGQVGAQLVRLLGPARCIQAARKLGPGIQWTMDLAQPGPLNLPHIVRDSPLEAIFCTAGKNDVEGCEAEPDEAMATNCRGPALLAIEAARRNIPFVWFSTEYVFNGAFGPYGEDARICPISAYGRSKAAGEAAVLAAHPGALVIRTTVVFGPDPGQRNFVYSLAAALRAGRRRRVPTDQISTPTYNADLASAALALVHAGAAGIFHACGPDRWSRFDFALACARHLGLPADLIEGVSTTELDQRAPRPLSAGLRSDKLHAQTGLRLRGVEAALGDWLKRGFSFECPSP